MSLVREHLGRESESELGEVESPEAINESVHGAQPPGAPA